MTHQISSTASRLRLRRTSAVTMTWHSVKHQMPPNHWYAWLSRMGPGGFWRSPKLFLPTHVQQPVAPSVTRPFMIMEVWPSMAILLTEILCSGARAVRITLVARSRSREHHHCCDHCAAGLTCLSLWRCFFDNDETGAVPVDSAPVST